MSKDSTTLGMVRASGEPVKEFPIEIGPPVLGAILGELVHVSK